MRSRLERFLGEHQREPDARARAAILRDALVEARVGIGLMRDSLVAGESELALERRRLEDAERRGRLAAAVPDAETVAVAERFVAKHRDRVAVLERKLAVQREELVLAEREEAELSAELRAVRVGGNVASPTATDSALNEAELREAAVEAQLAHLKRKLKGPS